MLSFYKFNKKPNTLHFNDVVFDDIRRCTDAASSAFGRLESCLWNKCGICLGTKVADYKTFIIANLLPCSVEHLSASCMQPQPVPYALPKPHSKDQLASQNTQVLVRDPSSYVIIMEDSIIIIIIII